MSKMECCCDTTAHKGHPSHNAELPRLNRISGQIDGIKKMIDEGRYCPDILTQLRAVRAAIRTVETSILESHLHHCVSDAARQGNDVDKAAKIAEIVTLFKRYED